MSELTIRHATPDDWPQIVELGADTFPFPGTREEAIAAWMRLSTAPYFKWDHIRLGLLDGQIVSHVAVMDFKLRYGQAELTFGGLAAVLTHPDFRKQGYSAHLLRDTIRYMEEVGYHITLLDGIPRYYPRFEYTGLWPYYNTKFTVGEAQHAADDGSGYRVRPYVESDFPAVYALYKEEWTARPWFTVRPAETFQWKLQAQTSTPMTYIVENASGVVRGYSVGRKIDFRLEVVTADREAAAALLRHTGALLAESPDTIVTWVDLPNSRTARFIRQLCGVTYHKGFNHNGGWMGRFISPQEALNILRPEFVERLRCLGVSEANNLVLEAGPEWITFSVEAISMQLTPSHLLQLMFGYLSQEDIDEWDTLTPHHRDFLKRLFPPVINGLAGLDWF